MPDSASLTINPASPTDIPLVQSLARAIWREYYPRILASEQIEYMLDRMYSPEAISADMESGTAYYLVHADGAPAGYLAFGLEPGPALRLDKLYLLASFRGRGLGQRMLEHVRNEAGRRGAREMTLRVNKRNADALAAYARFGFERAGELTEDIGGGYAMDDYVLRLVTSPPAPR